MKDLKTWPRMQVAAPQKLNVVTQLPQLSGIHEEALRGPRIWGPHIRSPYGTLKPGPFRIP